MMKSLRKIPLIKRSLEKFVDKPLGELKFLSLRVEQLRTELDALRSRMEIGDALVQSFQDARKSPEYQSVYAKVNPLVTVCVGTYNRAELVTERCLRSLIAQTYKNLQIVVIGDHCTDDTEKRVAALRDSRIHFENFAERSNYPEDPNLCWMVAGTYPFNRAMALAEGAFVTHLDDDDEHLPNRVERLVTQIQAEKSDLIWHPFWLEREDSVWELLDEPKFQQGGVSTSSVMYHRWLTRIGWDADAYKQREPGDANRFRKLNYLGLKLSRCPEALLRHYRQQNQKPIPTSGK